jgi:hypothetical protein
MWLQGTFKKQHKNLKELNTQKEKTTTWTAVELCTDKLIDYLILLLIRGIYFMISVFFWPIIRLVRKERGTIGIGVTRF